MSIASSTVRVARTSRPPIEAQNRNTSGSGLTRTTGRWVFNASATSDAVPALIPHTKTTLLESTLTTFRASRMPVTIRMSAASAASVAVSPGRTPTVRPPACFAPRSAASITPLCRPPVSVTQPSPAMSCPRRWAAARSFAVAPSPGPMTPTVMSAIEVDGSANAPCRIYVAQAVGGHSRVWQDCPVL